MTSGENALWEEGRWSDGVRSEGSGETGKYWHQGLVEVTSRTPTQGKEGAKGNTRGTPILRADRGRDDTERDWTWPHRKNQMGGGPGAATGKRSGRGRQ